MPKIPVDKIPVDLPDQAKQHIPIQPGSGYWGTGTDIQPKRALPDKAAQAAKDKVNGD